MNLISFVSNNFDALITVLVLAMSIILFIKNTIAPELTGLLCVGIFIATGVLSPETALAGFGSPSLITLMGLFAVSSALFKSGALDRVRELISSENVKTPRKLISLIAFLIAPISGIVPNTPVVASLLPLIEGWCARRNISPSKVLLPLSFFTLLVIIHACVFLTNFYSIKIDKTGINEKTSNEGIIAPFIFFILSAILCYGLADKIYA